MSDSTILDVIPVPKPRMTRSDVWKQRPAVMRYRAFKDSLRDAGCVELPAEVDVIFHVPMPKSWSLVKRVEMLGKPHQQKPDVDNYLKSLMDAVCSDDSYIYDARARKIWAYTGSIEFVHQTSYNDSEKD